MPHPLLPIPAVPLPRALAAALVLCASWGAAHAQRDASADALEVQPAHIRLGIERTRLPGNERMGLVGTSYLLDLGHGFSGGPAAYGAISGRRGGLFVVGAEAAWRAPLPGPLALEVGAFAGGGGGGAAPVGGGLMVRPHADLLWDFGRFQAGVSWSQVRFVNGSIDSRQLGLVWRVDTDFRTVPADRLASQPRVAGRTGMGFDRVQGVFGIYRPRGTHGRTSGAELPRTIGLVGARLERSLGENTFWGVEAAGAGSGGVGGYAEYLGTAGAETALGSDFFTLGARAALGMGGGGDVSTGGGLLMKGGAYGIVRLAGDLGLTLEGGVARAPQGRFKALYATAALNWVLDDGNTAPAMARVTRTEWSGGVERYDAARRDGSVRALQAVTLKVNRYLSPWAYLSGQARSAGGGGAGGYTAGLIGLGVRVPLSARWHVAAEALAGAAGGGGVDTQGGALVQPMAYLGVDVTRSLAVQLGGGRIRSLRGSLSSSVAEAALVYTFGVTSRDL